MYAVLLSGGTNPFGEDDDGFIFFGLKPHTSTDYANWNKYLRRTLEVMGYKDTTTICFHSWRHFFCSRMMDKVQDKPTALVNYTVRTIPELNIKPVQKRIETAIVNCKICLNDYDYIISATGNHNVNL